MKKLCIILLLLCTQVANSFPTVTEINPAIYSLMQQVDIDSLEAKIRYMQNLGVRAADCPEAVETQNYLYQKYQNYNLDLEIQYVVCDYQCPSFWYVACDTLKDGYTFPAGNVIAIQKGTKYPDEYIIVCSHYDSYRSPGADDNASGTSGVLEIARVLSKHLFKRSIIYINFAAEERGLWGSRAYADRCKAENKNILGVFNLDMIGYNYPEWDWEINDYSDMFEPLEIVYNGEPPIAKEFGKYFGEVANLYLPDIPAKPKWINPQWPAEYGRGDDAPLFKTAILLCIWGLYYLLCLVFAIHLAIMHLAIR